METNSSRIIAIANEKGGVGKTATVINLGAALASGGNKVLIVDMDPQFNATRGLGIETEDGATTVYDLISYPEAVPVEEALIKTKWNRLDLIPSHTDLAGAEIELINEDGRENRLAMSLERITEKYDFILIDTPPSLSLLTVNVFACATEVLVPCQTQPYAYAALEDLFDTIFSIKEEINPDLGITGIVATFYDKRTSISRNILEKLKSDDQYKDMVLDTVIRTNTTIAASTDVGKPVIFYRKSSYGASDYFDLAREIA